MAPLAFVLGKPISDVFLRVLLSLDFRMAPCPFEVITPIRHYTYYYTITDFIPYAVFYIPDLDLNSLMLQEK